MVRIRLLLSSFLIVAGAVQAEGVTETVSVTTLWPCGVTLLPCRLPVAASAPSFPYWRGHLANRAIRASYTPVFPNRKTRK